ncbi:hypothetical protein TrCOL_g11311 [Triparma columacea]|uniref:K Homology domain-containing protein n=1 Tax=Triparma columacea TaxID=722753 RepID=A0A9W7FXW7_9STRA|nr:hypothetical protein TrCOL_g11311 [Triparma columacea]
MSALTALEKAKAIAAKLNSNDETASDGVYSSDIGGGTNKRNRADSADGERPSKLSRDANGGGDSSGLGDHSEISVYGNGRSDTEESINVPNAVIGYVIGRGGESIKNIQSVTGCNVQIQREQDMPPGSNVRRVTFKSPEPSTVAMAKAMVEKMVKDRLAAVSGGGSSSGGGGGGVAERIRSAIDAGHSSIKVKIPDSDVGLIIGKGGQTIRSIQDRTGGNIQIPSQADSDDPTVRTCVITHPTREGCDQTKELMEDVLLKRGDGAGGGATIGMGGVTITMAIPDRDVGMVIGRGGSVIKEIQRQTKARFQIPPAADVGMPHRTCTISGTNDSVQQVKQIVERMLVEQNTAFFMGGQPNSMGQGGYGGGMGNGQPQGAYGYGGQQQGYYGHHQQQQPHHYQQQQQQQQQQPQKDYSKEWAAYYAAQAQQQQQQRQPAAPAPAQAPASAPTQEAVATDPTAYYEQFWQYTSYYGEEAARKYYGAWSPPVGTPHPNPSASPKTNADDRP